MFRIDSEQKKEGLYSSAHRITARVYVDICVDADTDIALLDLDFADTFEGGVECVSGFDPGRSRTGSLGL